MNYRQNTLRTYRFQGPDWIPIASGYPSMMWQHYAANELQALMQSHPILFPGYQPGDPRENRVETRPDLIAGKPYTDAWGCVWETAHTGMVGHVTHHPLADWKDFETFQSPNAEETDGLLALDWEALLKMTSLIKQNGILVHEHTDGYMMEIVDDLIEAGGDILNLQDLVNGIDNIARTIKGRLAIDLDIDRQSITVRGTPKDIDDHIRECVVKLGNPQGGLSLVYQAWPPTPLENIRATWNAMEKYCDYYK